MLQQQEEKPGSHSSKHVDECFARLNFSGPCSVIVQLSELLVSNTFLVARSVKLVAFGFCSLCTFYDFFSAKS